MRTIVRVDNAASRVMLSCGHFTFHKTSLVDLTPLIGGKKKCHKCERLKRKEILSAAGVSQTVPVFQVCQDHQAEMAGVQIGRAPNGTLTLWLCLEGQARLRVFRLKQVQFTNLLTGVEVTQSA